MPFASGALIYPLRGQTQDTWPLPDCSFTSFPWRISQDPECISSRNTSELTDLFIFVLLPQVTLLVKHVSKMLILV